MEQSNTPSARPPRRGIGRELLSWVLVLGGALLAALFLTNFVIISGFVPTGSMQNTINPGDRFIGSRLSYLFDGPERGDIVVFPYPDDESVIYVKRVIGLPGEIVEVKDGYVYINGHQLQEDYIAEQPLQDSGPWTVPEDCYFMMGDNRNHSNDSRAWENPFVHKDKILGKVLFRYWKGFAWLA